MEIVILGAGTAIPSPGFSPASILLKSEFKEALIDMGPGTLQRAAQFGVNYLDLDTIFLTHLHSDHTLDLITLFQVNDSTPEKTRLTPLQIYGCLGTKTWYKKIMKAYPGISPISYALTILEKGKEFWFWGGLKISTILTGHTENSLAYRFEGPEGSFIFSGDTVFSDELVRFCDDADLLVCECSFPTGWFAEGHMTANDVGELAQRANVKHLVVTHRYPPAFKYDIASQIGKIYSGMVTLACDGLSFSISRNLD